MSSKRKPWEFYLNRESKDDIYENQSCFSLNLSELSTNTAIRNIVGSQKMYQSNYEATKMGKSKVKDKDFSEHLEGIANCGKKSTERDAYIKDESSKESSLNFNVSEFLAKSLPRQNSKTSRKLKSKFDNCEKLWEIERYNKHLRNKLLKAKPTSDIKKSTSQMALLQIRSEKHVPAATIQRRQNQHKINTMNGVIQKKLSDIASK